MISVVFLFACASRHIDVGVIDIVDPSVCVIQMADESILEITPSFCKNLREGDIIKVRRNE